MSVHLCTLMHVRHAWLRRCSSSKAALLMMQLAGTCTSAHFQRAPGSRVTRSGGRPGVRTYLDLSVWSSQLNLPVELWDLATG